MEPNIQWLKKLLWSLHFSRLDFVKKGLGQRGFSAAGAGRLFRIEGRMSGCDLSLGPHFTFQHDIDLKQIAKAKTTLEWLQDKSLTVL